MYGDETMTEVQDIIDRCKECGSATSVAVLTSWDAGNGRRAANLHTERLEHTRKHCAEMVRLAREEWPTLW